MNRVSITRHAVLLILLCVLATHAFGGIEENDGHIDYPGWFQHGLIDLETDRETVAAEGKTAIMALFTTEGCSYCAQFIARSLGDQEIANRVQERYLSIGLEIFDDAEMTDQEGNDLPIKQFAETWKAGMAPTLLFFDDDGQLIHRAIGYQSPERFTIILDYLDGQHYLSQTFREYVTALKAPEVSDLATLRPMRDDALFSSPPYALDRSAFPASQPLLVLFESPGCADCEALHDNVLSLDEVRDSLEKFEVVRLDATDTKTTVLTPDGTRLSPADWYAKEEFSRLPALLLANENGLTVLKTDAHLERQRMRNAMGLVLERAYEKGWSYQRFARSKAIERNLKAAQE